MARIIECQVKDEYVKGAGVVIGGASSHDDVSLKLIFSPMWAGLAKQLTWLNARGENPIIQLLTTDLAVDSNTYVVPIPYEAKEYAGNPTMSVRGNTVDDHEISVAINSATWEASALGGQDGIFKFVYNGGWTYQDASVTLATYGLTLTGTAKNNDSITVVRATVSSVSSVTATATAFHEEFVATITQTAEFIVLESVYDETAQSSQDVTATQAAQLQAEIDDIKDDILDARAAATEAAASATQASNSATSASGSAIAASGSATAAGVSAGNASTQATNSANSATLSQSWAVGGTGTRSGEDTNNAKYWAEQASQSASGDMKKSVYDSTSAVQNAGGIAAYVDANGGKIDHIKVNSVEQTIVNKTVDLTVPTALADLTSDATHRVVTDTEKTTWGAKANAPTYVTSTLDADNWSNSTYSFEGTYPFASYDIEVSLAPTATESERDAYAEGMMTGSPNSNVITALGTVPTDDIPVFIKVRSK